MHRYCTGWAKKSRKTVLIWKRKRSSSTKTMHGRVHTCTVSMDKIMEFKLEFLQHSPDLAPSDFSISELEKMARWPTVHIKRRGHRQNRFPFWGPSKILVGLKKFEKCLEKCIELKEKFEKLKKSTLFFTIYFQWLIEWPSYLKIDRTEKVGKWMEIVIKLNITIRHSHTNK